MRAAAIKMKSRRLIAVRWAPANQSARNGWLWFRFAVVELIVLSSLSVSLALLFIWKRKTAFCITQYLLLPAADEDGDEARTTKRNDLRKAMEVIIRSLTGKSETGDLFVKLKMQMVGGGTNIRHTSKQIESSKGWMDGVETNSNSMK